MKTHRLVMPGDLNQYGFLFGGKMLSWVDEACWIAASLEFTHCHFVTIGMTKVEFHHGVGEGVILEIKCSKSKEGTTSVCYDVEVRKGRKGSKLGKDGGKDDGAIFSTSITFVNVDEAGNKCPIR